MFEVVYATPFYYAIKSDDTETYGPYFYASEAQEKCDELNGEDYE